MGFIHRLSAVLLCLGLVTGSGSICAGWAGTPEVRMACCEDGTCPMHQGGSHHAASDRDLTQSDVDNCCASPTREDSTPSTPTVIASISSAVLGPGTALPASVPALVLSDAWRTDSPVPTPPVPRHVLLSVFLI